ncbi:kinase-like domain-containing protein [Rhodofomes roseus]|uniref:Kinase-like domain-containing protein n=1 Tax=Rhodofomes roseus TaxID=34475 RepID=A0ABQ8KTK8_9APHY|nr:kinase-like domain-containing protein [Rhodofomes roseus]KAH9842422.1 kinase-like domain-containing protein [Rhodofomes roseus]
MAARSAVASALAPATLVNALGALKERVTALFPLRASRYIPPMTSTIQTRPDASTDDNNSDAASPHLLGTVIATSIGFGHASPTNPERHHNILSLLGLRIAKPFTSVPITVPNNVDVALDMTIDDETPQSNTSVYSRIMVSVAVQVSPPSCQLSSRSSLSSSSSSDSDPPFECFTPLTTGVELHGPQKVLTLEPPLPLDDPLPTSNSVACASYKEHILVLHERMALLGKVYEETAELAIQRHHLADAVSGNEEEAYNTDSLLSDVTDAVDVILQTLEAFLGSKDEGIAAESDIGVLHDTDTLPYTEVPPDAGDDSDGTGLSVFNGHADSGTQPAATTDDDEPQVPAALYNRHTNRYYQVNGIIGCGGFARVFEVTTVDGHYFAVKIVHKAKAYRAAHMRDRLLDEKGIMSSVTQNACAGLIPLIESWEDEENIYFVMPLCRGSLTRYISYKAFLAREDPYRRQPEWEVLPGEDKYFCAESVFSVWQLHTAGIMHRDIKPENFLLDGDGRCILADFGIASITHPDPAVFERTRVSENCGTEAYMAPEQLLSFDYDFKVDIWQLGCMWIELLAGSEISATAYLPEQYYDLLSPTELQQEVRNIIEVLLCDHPALDLVIAMTDVNPAKRPTTVQIMSHEWFDGVDWSAIGCSAGTTPYQHRFFADYEVPSSKCSVNFLTYEMCRTSGMMVQRTSPSRLEARANVVDQCRMYDTQPQAFAWPIESAN